MASRLEKLSSQFKPEVPPIQQYRKDSKLDKNTLKQLCFGPNLHYREKVFEMIMKHRDVFMHSFLEEHDRSEERKRSAEQLLLYSANKPITYEEFLKNPNSYSLIVNALHSFDNALAVKMIAHLGLYFKTIFNLGTKRHERLARRAFDFKDIGCFGMTEMSHGSNVRGVRTEAHYCHQTKTFTIHTPRTQDMKFWIGAAANMANMSVVFAQLYIDGKCYGVHVYVVPLRDPDTHELYPGVLIGDCGPKMGLNGIDNGFIVFDKYRIPKDNQLDRLSGVDDNGNFFTMIPNEDKRFSTQLGSLSGGRVGLSYCASTTLINSLTIAIRYVLNRRQFSPPKSFDEILLFDYPLTRYRLMPLLASTVVYTIAMQQLSWNMDSNVHNLLDPNNKLIQQIHAISSVTKPITSWFTMETIDTCRQLLGGHGYSAFSRYANLFNDADVNQTWEGDNYVLLQQTVKYLLGNYKKIMKGKEMDAFALQFLKNVSSGQSQNDQGLPPLTEDNISDIGHLQRLFEERVRQKLNRLVARLGELKLAGKSDYESWQAVQANFANPLALAFGNLYFLQALNRALSKIEQSATKSIVESCGRLWAYRCLTRQAFGQEEERKLVEQRLIEECEKVAKESVAITDAMAPPQYIIGSPFADEHGQGMKRYYNMLYTGQDTFRKVEWYQQIVERERII